VIKTIFFDFFGTLAKFHPDREEIQIQALSQFGLNLNSEQIKYGYKFADSYMEKVNSSVKPLSLMDSDERTKFFSEYESLILDHAGFKVDLVTAGNIWRAVQQIPYGFKLYDDVIPVFKHLNTQNYKLGIITNMGKSLYEICDQLEISQYLSYIITSEEVGIGKPSPEIFKAALKVSESKVNEVIHVGDSYDSDIAGAIALDIKAILLDRDESQQNYTYQSVINELKTLYDHL
tara:strand:- start:2107 stop:2805 length:699 start_codon:yes stop_codon:yes gene_type:complete